MNIALKERAIASLAAASPQVQRAFIKQINFLARNLQHPSLHAKKYDEPLIPILDGGRYSSGFGAFRRRKFV